MKRTPKKITEHFKAEQRRRDDMRLSSNPKIASLERQAQNIAERARKEGLQ